MDNELLALAERVEALTGPDREVDAEIFLLQWPGYHIQTDCEPFPDEVQPGRIQEAGGFGYRTAPSYTAALDAAMSLVPEGWDVDIEVRQSFAHVFMENDEALEAEANNAATPALALTAAALRAIAAQQPSGAMTGE